MTDISIDSSKLPGVKEVCRDFAVLEDHSLAHTLQEQEIEHHLATNIQRNRLVKHDLQVAKQLQEEEELKAQAKDKHRHNELEDLDSEIAQEIQEKLVIEAESRRRQEEKDEDIARLLQEREEKRKKKHYPPHAAEEPYYPDHGGNRPKGHRDGPQGKLCVGGRIRDEDDAEIARRLQEEELKVNTVDYKAAQMAQDEEIARWLMEKEEKSYKKTKGRKRSDDQELSTHEHVRPRSKDDYQRSKSDKPYRPLPPPPDEDYNEDQSNDYTNRNSHSSPRPSSKSQSSHKGSHHRP
ncbi:PREDICTED: coiled-coil domain-containing protein 50 [Nanorana parkeri]|uniref:coiled-coil domain-containing protein 50 n=1 Tax=Nanorana parkeri TaxID=125878 RepID=UPI000854F0DC|nr:PREDICTED: coiled-coil domain-containing protein 50 [Nanorana parkeri]